MEQTKEISAEELDFLEILRKAYEWQHEENEKRVSECINRGDKPYDDLEQYEIKDVVSGKDTLYCLNHNRRFVNRKISLGGCQYSPFDGQLRKINDLKSEKEILLAYLRNHYKWDISNSVATNPRFEDELVQYTYKEISSYYDDIIKDTQKQTEELKENE